MDLSTYLLISIVYIPLNVFDLFYYHAIHEYFIWPPSKRAVY